jgi:hypothetical protein
MSTKSRRILLGLFLAASVLIPTVLVYRRGARRTPPGQQSLVYFERAMMPVFREDFNRRKDRPRMIVVLTMTGPEVLDSAARVQRVLAARPGRPLWIFLFWQPPGTAGGRPPTTEMLALVRDERVAQFWDAQRAMSGILGAGMSAPLYPEGAEWGDEPPQSVVAGTLADLEARLP